MATAVQIEITLDDKGAVVGMQRLTKSTDEVGRSGERAAGGTRRFSEEERRALEVFNQTRNAMEKYNEVVAELDRLQAKGQISTETHARAMRQAKEALDDSTKSAYRASDAAELLGMTFGVSLPRELRRFLNETTLIGPTLVAAFRVTVVAAFAAQLVELVPKIRDGALALGGYTAAMRELEKSVHDANQEIFKTFEDERTGTNLRRVMNRQIEDLTAKRDQMEKFAGSTLGQASTVLTLAARYDINNLNEQIIALTKSRDTINERSTELLKEGHEKAAKAVMEHTRAVMSLAEAQARVQELAGKYSGDPVIEKQMDLALKQLQERLEKETQVNDILIKANEDAMTAIVGTHGDAIAQILVQEQMRVTETTAKLEELGATEAQVDQAREAIHSAAMSRMAAVEGQRAQAAQEQWQQATNQMASSFESLWDDIASGNIGQRILNNFKKLIAQLVATWLMGLGQFRSAASGSANGFLGLLFGLLGIGSGTGGGGGSGSSAFGGFINWLTGGSQNTSRAATAGVLYSAPGQVGGSSAGFFGGGLPAPDFVLANNPNAPTLAYGAAAPSNFLSSLMSGKYFSHSLSIGGKTISGGALASMGISLGMMSMMGGYGTGRSLGGPLGAGIGAVVGGLAGIVSGLFGGAHKRSATQRMVNAALPQLSDIGDAYKKHQMDFGSAVQQLVALRTQLESQVRMGGSMAVYASSFLPRLTETAAEISRYEQDRRARSNVTFATPEFHSGGEVTAVLEEGEHVINKRAAERNRPLLEQINAGMTPARGVTIVIQAIEPRSFEDWLKNGGGMKAFKSALRRDGQEYAGEF